MAEIISIREFGRRVECSDTAVRKAIKEGIIVNGVHTKDNGQPAISFEIALAEWSARGGGEQKLNSGIENKSSYIPKNKIQMVVKNSNQQSQQTGTGTTTREEANRQKAILTAELLKIELAEKKGTLVNKAHVYKSLYEMGQVIRDSMLAIPDRIIDNLLSVGNESRNDAHALLQKEINETLQRVASTENFIVNGA
jgi:hypothetical protein